MAISMAGDVSRAVPFRALLAAGGTGGHMFPAQALAETLSQQGWDIAMITDARGKKHAGRIPADPIIDVQAASLSIRKPIAAIGGVMKLWRGTQQARQFIKTWRPNIVIGFGGYPAFPAMMAAQGLGVPTIIHEQNAVLGRVNRLFAKKADHIVSGFSQLTRLPQGVLHSALGNPLRAQIIAAIPQSYTAPKDRINVLVIGGSLGAKIISETLPKAMALLPERLRYRIDIVQQTRPEYQDYARQIYSQAGINAICETFFDDIENHLAKAHYVIGRAGAGSVSEIAVMGKPSLLVPLAIAMDDHQSANAKSLSGHNAADILPESEFTPEVIKSILETRLNDSLWLENAANNARALGRPNAVHDLATLVINTAR